MVHNGYRAGRKADCCDWSMHRIAIVLTLSLVTLHASVTNSEGHPYRKHWKHATFGKPAVAGVVVGAGVGQVRGSPKNYGGGASGFGKRLGAGFATHAVKTTVEHAIAAPLHED